jgi:hypothetical protein
LVYRGVVIPYAVRLWAPKTFCAKTHQRSYGGESIEFRKLTEMVGETIADFPLSMATVLFDAYYLCPTVTRACEAKRYHYVGVAKKNCNFLPDGREAEIFAAAIASWPTPAKGGKSNIRQHGWRLLPDHPRYATMNHGLGGG